MVSFAWMTGLYYKLANLQVYGAPRFRMGELTNIFMVKMILDINGLDINFAV